MSDAIIEKYWRIVAPLHDAAAYAVIDAAYREPTRSYHATGHIADLLRGLDRFVGLATRVDLVATAIFWHDVVYRTREADGAPRPDAINVEDSARLFEAHSKFPDVDRQAATDMILATRNHVAATATVEHYPGFLGDFDLFLDLDLSTLASPWPQFAENLEKIRFEYSWAPELTFCQARLDQLGNFEKDAHLYRRVETRAAWRDKAMANLTRSHKELAERIQHLRAGAKEH